MLLRPCPPAIETLGESIDRLWAALERVYHICPSSIARHKRARQAALRQYQATDACKPGCFIIPKQDTDTHPSKHPILVMTDNEMRQTARILPESGESPRETDTRLWLIAERYETMRVRNHGLLYEYRPLVRPVPFMLDA